MTQKKTSVDLSNVSVEDLVAELAKHKEKLLAVENAAKAERKKARDKKAAEKSARVEVEAAARKKLSAAASQIRGILEKAGVTGRIVFDLANKEQFFRYPVKTGAGGKREDGATLTPDKVKEIGDAISTKKLDGISKSLLGQYVASKTPPNGNDNVSEKGFESKAVEILGKKVAEDLFGTVETSRIIGNLCYKWNQVHRAKYETSCKPAPKK